MTPHRQRDIAGVNTSDVLRLQNDRVRTRVGTESLLAMGTHNPENVLSVATPALFLYPCSADGSEGEP